MIISLSAEDGKKKKQVRGQVLPAADLKEEGENEKDYLYYTEQMLRGIAPKYKDYMTTGAETPLHFQIICPGILRPSDQVFIFS